MAQPIIQTSFHAGEWAPALNARVDLAKYKAAAAELQNFFVDYRGGASSRTGTRYVLQCLGSDHQVRLIPFQASFLVTYVLEFGSFYIRFYNNGAPVLEAGLPITGVTLTNPCTIDVVNTFSTGDWVYITDVNGTTQLNGNYYTVGTATPGNISLNDLNFNPVDATTFTAWAGGGTVSRVYTLGSPYDAADDLSLIRFAQNVDTMILCHPDYPPYELRLVTATNWTLTTITFGTTISPPTGTGVATTLAAGSVYYSYVITTVDYSGQESVPSAAAFVGPVQDLRTVAGSNTISWTFTPNSLLYRVYKAELRYGNPVPAGAAYGFIGDCTESPFIDSNIAADFSITPPVAQNPFSGTGVVSYTVTVAGTYTSVPTVTVAPPSGGSTSATANAVLGVTGTPTVGAGGANYAVNDTITLANGVVVVVNTVAGTAVATFKAISVSPSNPGAFTAGTVPANPVAQVSSSGTGTGATVNLVWGVTSVTRVSSGAGYTAPPAVTFSAGAAAATAVLGAAQDLNPTVPGYFQQRLVLAGLAGDPQAFYMSQPGYYFNFNVSNPIEPDDAISAALVSGQLNTIQSMISMPSGLIFLTDRAAWQVDGGQQGSAVTPSNIVANSHSYNGASILPPIVANFDILFVQSKGSIVRDLTYNLYSNIYTGTDISVLSSQLFYGYQMLEWAWAEEPFKVVWVVRNDGQLLSLTFVKEQELIGWSHTVTEGTFSSICTVTETVPVGSVDAVYVVVERIVNGSPIKYIERFAERAFPNGAEDAWCVDSALDYDGPPETDFMGAQHLAGLTVTGLADGAVIDEFVMPADGSFSLAIPASRVVVGLPFTCRLQTLALDIGEPTVQGKRKKISAVTVRVQDTLGLTIGQTFDSVVDMKDLQLGNVGSATNEVVTNLVTGDARTIIDPLWSEPGQYCFQQTLPYPVTILGVMPEITVGDTAK